MNLDEIYDLFIWDASYSEEYAAREARGIAEASKLRNLYPFIQPIVLPPDKSKSVWEPCAKVIAMRSDEELQPYLHLLFKWLQDLNWPGAEIIFDRLAKMPLARIVDALVFAKHSALRNDDTGWMRVLEEFEKASINTGLSAKRIP